MNDHSTRVARTVAAVCSCLAALLASAAAGQQITALPSPKEEPQSALECSGISVRVFDSNWIFGDGFESGNSDAWGGSGKLFSASAFVDLIIDVQLNGSIVDQHVVHLRLETPKGHHYQTMSVPIRSVSGAVGMTALVEGYPRPLEVQLISNDGGGAVFELPVAGTSIVTSSLYGRWVVRAFLDQAPEPCSTSDFELVQ